jgi:Tfp pilus assembly protein PilZ
VSRLKLHLLERADFAKYHEGTSSELFVPGAEPPNVGARVTVEVVFQAGPRVLLHGFVLWRRTAGDARARPGSGIGIDTSEQAKFRYLLGYVRGGLLDVRERRRLPVRLRVAYSSAGKGRRVNFTRDINEEGAFVRTAEMLDIGASTLLLISPPGGEYKPLEVQGTVTRQQPAGGDRGVGVRFDFRDDHERARWAAFVGKLESDYLDGRLSDDALL